MAPVFGADIEKLKLEENREALIRLLSTRKTSKKLKIMKALTDLLPDVKIVEAVKPLFYDEDRSVRIAAMTMLSDSYTPELDKDLKILLSEGTLAEKIEMLRMFTDKPEIFRDNVSALLAIAVADRSEPVKIEALKIAAAFREKGLREIMIPGLGHRNHSVRKTTLAAIGSLGDERDVDMIVGLLIDSHPEVRAAARDVLGNMKSDRAKSAYSNSRLTILAKKMRESCLTRQEALQEIARHKLTEARGLAERSVHDRYKTVRIQAVKTIGELGTIESLHALKEALNDKYWDVRLEAVIALERFMFRESLEVLKTALEDRNSNVRARASRAVQSISERLERFK